MSGFFSESREHKDGAGPESTSQNDMTNLSVLGKKNYKVMRASNNTIT